MRVQSSASKLHRQPRAHDLVATARKDEVVRRRGVAGAPVVLAAVHVPRSAAQAPVLVLANPLDTSVIRALADRTNQAILLAGAAGSTAIAGPPRRACDPALTGRERGPFVDRSAAWPLGRAASVRWRPGVRVWTLRQVVVERPATVQRPSLP